MCSRSAVQPTSSPTTVTTFSATQAVASMVLAAQCALGPAGARYLAAPYPLRHGGSRRGDRGQRFPGGAAWAREYVLRRYSDTEALTCSPRSPASRKPGALSATLAPGLAGHLAACGAARARAIGRLVPRDRVWSPGER
jgi:hypothetical protein